MNLVLFDVDGTLLDNLGADDARYLSAFESEFGIRGIDADWSHYPHCTDSSITRVVLAAHFGRAATDHEIARARDAFVGQLRAAVAAREDVARPMRGAAGAIEHLGAEGWQLGLASGGWRASALFKLECSGLPVTSIPGGFADDDVSREGIISVARSRAESSAGRPARRVVYVGDATWDVKACAALAIPFVGIGRRERAAKLRAAGAETVFEDLTDTSALVAALHRVGPPR